MLIRGANVEFKTDNYDFFKYTFGILKMRKDIEILYKSNDLYKDIGNNFNIDNVQTEYEKKFLLQKKKICKIVWTYR